MFAPTCRLSTVRVLLAISAFEDLYLHSVDITTAFLNGDLDETIYMKQPQGFQEGRPDMVMLLQKAIYGVKQGSRQWNKKLHSVLSGMGFERLESEQSIYIYKRGPIRLIIPVFVDDLTIASSDPKAIDDFVVELKTHFELRDLGDTSLLLGIEITRDRPKRSINPSQRRYINDILARFNMADCNPVSTPMDPGLKLSKGQCASTPEDVAAKKDISYLSAWVSLHERNNVVRHQYLFKTIATSLLLSFTTTTTTFTTHSLISLFSCAIPVEPISHLSRLRPTTFLPHQIFTGPSPA